MKLESADSKAEPALNILNVLKQADLICHLWQQYVKSVLFPLANSVTTQREMAYYNIQALSQLENSASTLLQKLIDCMYLLIRLQYEILIIISYIILVVKPAFKTEKK